MVSNQDHLTEVMETFPLDVRFAGRFELGATWGLAVPEAVAMVFAVASGSCLVTADTMAGQATVAAGDLVLLSPGANHHVRDKPGSPTAAPGQWLDVARPGDPLVLKHGPAAASTVLRGGVFQFDDPRVHPFYWGLPPVVHLPRKTADQSLRIGRLLQSIDDEVSAELSGRQSVVKRLVEVLLIETARHCLAADGAADDNITDPLLHPDLGPALALMHRQPEKPWTVADLAERVAMSRSAFAAAFVKLLGQPPVQYLRERRMRLAGRLLRNPSLGLKEVAMRVGYDSVSAFNTAFKQWSGAAPGQYRGRLER